MVELQSCAGLVSASALCAIEQEARGESVNVNVIAEISAELQREKQKNAELMERISVLEARIQERDKDFLLSNGQGSCPNARERNFKKFKRQKIEPRNEKIKDGHIEMASQLKHLTKCMQPKDANLENCLVNWMSMADTQFLHFEKLKGGDSAADLDDTDDSDDEDGESSDEDDVDVDQRSRENGENTNIANNLQNCLLEDINEGKHASCVASSSGGQAEPRLPPHVSREINEYQSNDSLPPDKRFVNNSMVLKKHEKIESKMVRELQGSPNIVTSRMEIKGSGSISLQKRPPKLAFCPKEIKRIIESEALSSKNAQSHTIRKIIIFASLGIRHGCEDLYELDFNHFSILKKGKPYVSPKSPGEHVLYENPGVRRKIFYPNRQNPTLCPVQILEEEQAMRPSDASCPSCLFLCIKYGGRTRNLPQNEYVRQRMGRNKLKSFGPFMCQMAMLVNIRSGSFFFKALGITLLFMAGFPDDLVQKETKYRNLDLLQKYYSEELESDQSLLIKGIGIRNKFIVSNHDKERSLDFSVGSWTDKDAEGEELFLPHLKSCDALSPSSQLLSKALPTKSKGKKIINSDSKPQNLQKTSITHPTYSSSVPSAQFGLVGCNSIQTHAMPGFQSMPSQNLADKLPVSNPVLSGTGPSVSYHSHASYPMLSPHPPNTFVPMIYWPPPNAFPPYPCPSSYGYQSFPSTRSYIPIHSQPHYSNPSCKSLIPNLVEGTGKKNDADSEEADSDSNGSSSSTVPKEA